MSLAFSYQSGGTTPAAQNVSLTSSGTPLSYTAREFCWLADGHSRHREPPGSLSVSVNPTGLAVGTCTGNVTVTSAGASNSSQKITVTLGVTGTPPSGTSFNITPGSLSFTYASGTSKPGTQNLSIASSGTALQFTATASGGNWLTVSPATGSTPTTVKVSANPTGLAVGTYKGSITITSGGASNSQQTVPVEPVVSSTTSGRVRVWPSRAVTCRIRIWTRQPGTKEHSGVQQRITAELHGCRLRWNVARGDSIGWNHSRNAQRLCGPDGAGLGNLLGHNQADHLRVPQVSTCPSSSKSFCVDGGGEVKARTEALQVLNPPSTPRRMRTTQLAQLGRQQEIGCPGHRSGRYDAADRAQKARWLLDQCRVGPGASCRRDRNAEGITVTELGYDIRNGSHARRRARVLWSSAMI